MEQNIRLKENESLMSLEVASQELDFFAYQISLNNEYFDNPKEIIFYGGEPLLNFKVLKFVIEKSLTYKQKGKLPNNLRFSIVTNGLLLNEQIIEFLIKRDVTVSISIDGPSSVENSCRINKNGENVYKYINKHIHILNC